MHQALDEVDAAWRAWGSGKRKLLFVVSGVPGQAVRMWWFLCTHYLLGLYFRNLCSTSSFLLTSCAVVWDHWAVKMSMSLQWTWRNPGATGSDTYTIDNWKGSRRVLSQTAGNWAKIPGTFFQAHWRHFFLSCDSLFLWWRRGSILTGCSSLLLRSVSSWVLATLPAKVCREQGGDVSCREDKSLHCLSSTLP